ncbi:MAG: NADH-quinone oxidoreductase subunit M [Gammaproteobacteria bacterium]|nr:NADH-quinone oxidoreductase subunit M [Gammaproteobacteria bacterium]HJN00262.1 NADH-quinone oxidoreductase subunit M [Gammaproteobacteria bacterium]
MDSSKCGVCLVILDLMIWSPIMVGLIMLFINEKHSSIVYWVSVISSLLIFGLSLYALSLFDDSGSAIQFELNTSWIERFNINYHLGVDGISFPLILLTTFITPIVLFTARTSNKTNLHQYLASFLILEGLMIGVFSALDAFLFYVFWEAMLIPMFIIIGVWGGKNRVYATIKFFLYTFLGSVFMLIAIIYLYISTGSYSIFDFYNLDLSRIEQVLIFLAFLFAFAVKIPMWPVHTWLPDAHVEAPTGGSVILAAILLKMGGYGLLRFSLPITPDASNELSQIMVVLSLIAIIYIGMVALSQTDMKKLIAYSSVAHMGFVTLGTFVVFLNHENISSDNMTLAISGSMIQMVSHGLISGALFLCIGVMYDRIHSREIDDYGGVALSMPKFAGLMVFFALANAALPGTSGFVGEVLVIFASLKVNFWIAFLSGSTLIIGAAYTLWMIKRVIFGQITNEKISDIDDLNVTEFIPLMILAVMVIAMGIYPEPLMKLMHDSLIGLSETVIKGAGL